MRKTRARVKKEDGVTSISLRNAEILLEWYGQPNLVKLWYDEREWSVVTVEWPNDFKHSFTGFSWGYTGEGPHGLEAFAEAVGLGSLLDMRTIAGLPRDAERLFQFIPKAFGGKPEWVN